MQFCLFCCVQTSSSVAYSQTPQSNCFTACETLSSTNIQNNRYTIAFKYLKLNDRKQYATVNVLMMLLVFCAHHSQIANGFSHCTICLVSLGCRNVTNVNRAEVVGAILWSELTFIGVEKQKTAESDDHCSRYCHDAATTATGTHSCARFTLPMLKMHR